MRSVQFEVFAPEREVATWEADQERKDKWFRTRMSDILRSGNHPLKALLWNAKRNRLSGAFHAGHVIPWSTLKGTKPWQHYVIQDGRENVSLGAKRIAPHPISAPLAKALGFKPGSRLVGVEIGGVVIGAKTLDNLINAQPDPGKYLQSLKAYAATHRIRRSNGCGTQEGEQFLLTEADLPFLRF